MVREEGLLYNPTVCNFYFGEGRILGVVMSTMFFIQFAVVLLCILIGAQVGGIGLGVLGGIGLAVLSFWFPSSADQSAD